MTELQLFFVFRYMLIHCKNACGCGIKNISYTLTLISASKSCISEMVQDRTEVTMTD